MQITALGNQFYNHPKSIACRKRVSVSAPKTMSADIFCFKGSNSLKEKVGIIRESSISLHGAGIGSIYYAVQ